MGKRYKVSPPLEELLVIDSFWEKEPQFSLILWPPVCLALSSERYKSIMVAQGKKVRHKTTVVWISKGDGYRRSESKDWKKWLSDQEHILLMQTLFLALMLCSSRTRQFNIHFYPLWVIAFLCCTFTELAESKMLPPVLTVSLHIAQFQIASGTVIPFVYLLASTVFACRTQKKPHLLCQHIYSKFGV